MGKSEPVEDPMFSAKLRLARANRRLHELDAQIAEFFAGNPLIRITDLDPDGVHAIHKVQFATPFHIEWCMLVTEIIEHLRASLDHAVYATRTVDPTRYAYFPCAKFEHIENAIKGRAKDTPPEIQAVLKGLDPHDKGDNLFYALNELCNASKHGLIMLVAGVGAGIQITGPAFAGGVQFYEPPVWDHAKNEIKYARTKRGQFFEHDGHLLVFVAVQDTDGSPSPLPATRVLGDMLNDCMRAVGAIEEEAHRIGAFS
jgi:hypothetical protein